KAPVINPVGPMMRRISLPSARKVAGFMFRSNVISRKLTVAFWTKLSLVIGWPGTNVLTTCGPGTINGRLSRENGGVKYPSGSNGADCEPVNRDVVPGAGTE